MTVAMSCQCYQIGGPFIKEDPDCALHGHEAQALQAVTKTALDELRDEIAELRRAIVELRADNAELRARLVAAAPA